MLQGILGRKLGMTQIFDEQGRWVGVTVIEAGPCPVTQVKTAKTDGYNAVQLGFAKRKRVTKEKLPPMAPDSPQPLAPNGLIGVSVSDGTRS